jgi:uncharacterized membrane protein
LRAHAALASVAQPVAVQACAAFAALAATAAVSAQLEQRTAWGRRASAPLLAMALAASTSAALPAAGLAAAVDCVWGAVLPLALALALLTTDLRQLGQSRDALLAFVCACTGTLVGTIIAFCATARWLGQDGWKLAACLCASYTGGTLNFGATATIMGLGGDSSGRALITAAMALDNVAMAAFLGLLVSMPVRSSSAAVDADSTPPAVGSAAAVLTDAAAMYEADDLQQPAVTVRTAGAALATALACCAAAQTVAARVGCSGAALALVAIFASTAATGVSALARKQPAHVFAGAEAAASSLLLLFFAALGACTSVRDAVSMGGAAGAYNVIVLGVHLAVTLALGASLRLPRRLLLLASNAAVGGPATAAAMASARGWRDLTHQAVLLGTLGYIVGTALGVAIGAVLQSIAPLLL